MSTTGKKTIKSTKIWRQNNTLLNNQQIAEEMEKEIKICIEVNENENTTTQNLSIQFSSVIQSCPNICNPIYHSTPRLPVHYKLQEFNQTHIHWVSDTIQPSDHLPFPSPPALNISQHQGLFKWVSSSHQVAKVFETQLQHQSFQWTFRTDIL